MGHKPVIDLFLQIEPIWSKQFVLQAMVANFAIVILLFALAAFVLRVQKERAFQASSPKTFIAVLRGGFFLPADFEQKSALFAGAIMPGRTRIGTVTCLAHDIIRQRQPM